MSKFENLEQACGGSINPDTLERFAKAMREYDEFMGGLGRLLGPVPAPVDPIAAHHQDKMRREATNRARREQAALGDFADWLNAIDARHSYECRQAWGTVDQWRALFDAGRTKEEAAEHLKWNSCPRAL